MGNGAEPDEAGERKGALELIALERMLHQPGIRADPERLRSLLHPDFSEIGRSGRVYSREDLLRTLPREEMSGTIWSDGFSVDHLHEGVALVTYRSAHRDPEGALSRLSLRSSIWVRTGTGWQMRFHQGTPAAG